MHMNTPPAIRRGFINLGPRQLHYRTAGSGDVVVLIHQSPTSARTLDAQTRGFAQAGFCAIAIDIPGLGRSDPLGLPQPEIGDQAIALEQALNALGLGRVALYGSHTGALICCAFAVRAPQRVSVVLIDGYPIYTPGESERRVATYFPSFEPRWDGGHLLWLWARLREQYLFWPWNIPGESTAARCDIPDPAFLTDGVVDLLRVGNAYRLPYAAAFRCSAAELLASIRVPTWHLAAPDDSLTQALGLLEGMPACSQVATVSANPSERVQQEIALLDRHRPGAALPDFTGAARTSGGAGLLRGYVDSGLGQLAIRIAATAGNGRPLVMLPPAPGSGRQIEAELSGLAADRPVIAIDAPGCGDSGVDHGDVALSITDMTAALRDAVRQLGATDCDLYGQAGGANLALRLAVHLPSVRRVVIQSPVCLPEVDQAAIDRYAPAIRARPDGTHLIAFWHQMRNRHLFRPWYDERLQARRTDPAGLAVDRLDREVLAMLESWRSWHRVWAALLCDDPRPGFEQLGDRARALEYRHDEFAGMAPALGHMTPLPEAVWTRCELIAAALGP